MPTPIASAGPVVVATFAVPLAAAAAAVGAAAVPVLIHLLSRQRYQVVPWAAVRFLKTADKRSRRRIDRWLLLAARMLAVLLPLAGMAAATPWAEPAWQAIAPGAPEAVSTAPRTHHVLLIDASLSMTAAAGGRTRFDKAVELAERAVRRANGGDGFTVIRLAAAPDVAVPGPANNRDKVAAELLALKPTHGPADLSAGLAAAADALSRSPRTYPRRQVLVFTDMQRSAVAGVLPRSADGPPPEVWNRLLPGADVAVVDVAGADVDNLAVVDLRLADPLPLVDAPTAVTAAVHNFGTTDRRNVRVELAVGRPAGGGRPADLLPVEQRVLGVVPAGQRTAVTFEVGGAARFREPGVHVLQLRVLDADDLPADDARAVAAEVRDGLTAVVVDGRPAADPLRRAAYYLAEALDPGGRRLASNPARPKVLSAAEFNDPALGDLTAADVVFLCDLPGVTPAQAAKLDAHLKRGGGVVVGLGPTAAAHLDEYNRVLFADGGGLLPGKLVGVKAAADGPDAPGFRLAADEDAYRRPPLAAFRDDNARAGLIQVPFRRYVQLDAPAAGRARRVLSFVPEGGDDPRPPGSAADKPDPAVVEVGRHRGRVVVYASSFQNDWTDWPVLPSFLPFAHEVLRFAAANPGRHTVRAGDAVEEFFPPAAVGLTAAVDGPGGLRATPPIVAGDEVGVARFAETTVSGVYRVSGAGRPATPFAVNPADLTPAGGSESDLKRAAADDLKAVGNVQVVADPGDVRVGGDGAPVTELVPRPHGPTIARWLVAAAVAVLLVELWLAWKLGPSRAHLPVAADRPGDRGSAAWAAVGLAPLVLAGGLLFTAAHAAVTGDLLGFVPKEWRQAVEGAVGVPAAGPGESTRWRLEGSPAFVGDPAADRAVLAGLAVAGLVGVIAVYRRERRAAGGVGRVAVPVLLRSAVLLLAAAVVLPQLRLAFEREGWPDVALIVDTSGSMATVDELTDAAVRAAAADLGRAAGATPADRLQLAQALLTRPDRGLIARLLADRRVKVGVYAVDDGARLAAEAAEPADLGAALKATAGLTPAGDQSRLGDGLRAVVKAFRGGSLEAAVVLTDGVVTAGEELPAAAREAARAGVPVYLVAVGDAVDPADLVLSDLAADEAVVKGDRLVFEARLTARGPAPGKPVAVVLSEKVGDKLVERAREQVAPDPAGRPTPVRLSTVPAEAGEKTFVIAAAAQPGEADTSNNRVERAVRVDESRKLKVLYVEGYPRYEFRFVKALLERETEAEGGPRAVDLSALLLDASPGYAEQDRSARKAVPTKAELFEFDAVLFGDVDPAKVPKAAQFFADLGEFVKVRGGGLMFIAGPQADPAALFATPLADLLPVVPADGPRPDPADLPADGYRPKLTAYGRSHPLFRFAPDEAANARVWAGLKPLVAVADGYKRKPSAEVLAAHPDRPADGYPGETHPLVLQQFVGAGRVLFVGFDDTWRWRWRRDEPRFDQYWGQAVRALARGRVSRPELRTDKQTAYRRGDPIRLTVRFPDDAPAPADAAVRVTVERWPVGQGGKGPPAESEAVQLAKADDRRATYQAVLTRTPDGDYRFRFDGPASGGPASGRREPADAPGPAAKAEAKVLPPPGERDRLEPDRPAILRAAADGRGKAYTLADADRLIGDLPEGERVPLDRPVPPVAVWNHAGLFGLVVALLAAEWWLRRRDRLL